MALTEIDARVSNGTRAIDGKLDPFSRVGGEGGGGGWRQRKTVGEKSRGLTESLSVLRVGE